MMMIDVYRNNLKNREFGKEAAFSRCLRIIPSQVQGNLKIPPSKSHTLRAILFGVLAEGTSLIKSPLSSPDTEAMLKAAESLGASYKIEGDSLWIQGTRGHLRPPPDVIDCGNSGLVLRMIGALGGLIPHYTVLTGDASLRTARPLQPLIDGLRQLGAFAASSLGNGYAPLLVKGPFTGSKATIDGEDSQPVSALLIAAALAPFSIEIFVKNPGEKPWIEMTLDWLSRLKIVHQHSGDYTHYQLAGSSKIHSFSYEVPGDWSSAAFPMACALLTDSEITLENLDFLDVQGDKKVMSLLEEMGAQFRIDQENKKLFVKGGSSLHGIEIDINDCIDALPILSVIGCFAKGKTILKNAKIARRKESDRIHVMAQELTKMGAKIEEKEEGLVIYHSPLKGAELMAHQDHRVAMSLSVAALAAKGPSTLQGAECVRKTYPTFYEDLSRIGAKFQ